MMTKLEHKELSRTSEIVGTEKQESIETKSGLLVWETWTHHKEFITHRTFMTIRYFAQDKDGGKVMRLSFDDFLYHITENKK